MADPTRTTVQAVPFTDAEIGDLSYVYSDPNGEMLGDFGWVTGLEWFDDRWAEVKVKRRTWMLVAEDELVLPDPCPVEDDDAS